MFYFFAIPIVQQTVAVTPTASSFFAQPIDVIFYDFFIWFGWIPLATTLAWGFTQMWQNYRQGIFVSKLKFILLAIDVPSMTEQTPKALENLFSNMYGAKSSLTWKEEWIEGKLHPVFSFEIISSEGYIQFLIRTQTRFRDMIEAGIYAQYPDAEISEVEDYTQYFPSEYPDDDYEMWGSEFTLDKPDMYPIRTYVEFEDKLTGEIKDPLGYTLEQMAKMRPGEHFWFQMLVQPSSNEWTKDGIKRLNQLYGKKEKVTKGVVERFFQTVLVWPFDVIMALTNIDLNGMFFGIEEAKKEPYALLPLQETKEADGIYRKISKVGLGAKIRILYVAKKNAFVKIERTAIVKGILNQYADLSLNKFALFIPQIPKDDYFWMRWEYTKKQRTLMTAYKKRSWGIGSNPVFLNTEELASLWHFPAIGIKAPLVKKAEARRAEPPVGLPITFLENTLPQKLSEPEQGLSSAIPSQPPFTPLEKSEFTDIIGTAQVPKIRPPTQPNIDDSFVPPNLPT